MELIDKEVYFNEWCPKCKYFKAPDGEDPCNTCLNNPSNYHSHKPVKFEEN